jgi:hypothetical protein
VYESGILMAPDLGSSSIDPIGLRAVRHQLRLALLRAHC